MTTLDWLLNSDPAIRWQVLRDLVHAPPSTSTPSCAPPTTSAKASLQF
jgi:hypothetical protein